MELACIGGALLLAARAEAADGRTDGIGALKGRLDVVNVDGYEAWPVIGIDGVIVVVVIVAGITEGPAIDPVLRLHSV